MNPIPYSLFTEYDSLEDLKKYLLTQLPIETKNDLFLVIHLVWNCKNAK